MSEFYPGQIVLIQHSLGQHHGHKKDLMILRCRLLSERSGSLNAWNFIRLEGHPWYKDRDNEFKPDWTDAMWIRPLSALEQLAEQAE